MTNEIVKRNPKRDIFHFKGDRNTALNLEHVTQIEIFENKITFSFYTNAIFVELETSEMAKNLFEQVLNVWGGDAAE